MPKRAIYLLSPTSREDTIALPMIDFQITAHHIDFKSCNTLMFTSKQAVKSADNINKEWKNYPCLAIGSATAKQIVALGGKVAYKPNSFYGKTLSKAIIEKFRDKNILYLRPKEVSFDSKGFLEKFDITLQEQIIYETNCIKYNKKKQLEKNAIIIFTSPSTIHCFFKSFPWDESYTAIVIGRSTKVHLPKSIRYFVANEPTIDACIDKAKDFSLKSNA